MLKPIAFENDHLLIHPFRSEDLQKYDQLVADIYTILSDDRTLKYLPAKRINNLKEAETFLQTMILGSHSGRNHIHFIHDKKLDKVIGLIDIISPEMAREFYNIKAYPYFIEFYLSSSATGCYIMTEILPAVVDAILNQGIESIGAVVNRKNIAAKRVLEKANFTYKARFDALQDLYETA
ncbi:MAG: GNAT family N-acetyltransferase [Candidatus Pedobacter colombiensis]|uniref:GNAT family N-acetyltransferase n=1 Tax=Candidatus Pedobacter colombiensis TaxID=3121371 RepID=A0AAJ6B802_9SPHI|nr:GNAT family N-acetyltransferase [Pedobacter sp.]WEK20404.1 MAG: GNAT family N-acetyltransferase [Pedobacter sp.]